MLFNNRTHFLGQLALWSALIIFPAAAAICVWILTKALISPPRTYIDPETFSKHGLFEPAAGTGFQPRSNVSMTDVAGANTFRIYTDNRGARISGPDAANSSPGVIAVGCSQTWGHGVENSDTFLSKLSDALHLSAKNLAVSGYGGASALVRLRQSDDLRPHYVLYGLWEDHFNRNVRPCLEGDSPICIPRAYIDVRHPDKAQLVKAPAAPWAFESIRRWYTETSVRSDREKSTLRDIYWTGALLWKSLASNAVQEPTIEDKSRAMQFVLTEMHSVASSMGAHLIVVYIPNYLDGDIEDPPRDLVSLAETAGFTLATMSGTFRRLRRSGIEIQISGDGHIDRAAHSAIAEELARLVRSRDHNESWSQLRRAKPQLN